MTPEIPIPRALRGEKHFRWRGGAVSRVEGLSDAVFALSLTLLVLTLEPPRTFDAMMHAFTQLPAFAACFALLNAIWYFHFRYHRRFGLEDGPAIWLNVLMLFVVLLYVYPLKFTTMVLFEMWFRVSTWWPDPDAPAVVARLNEGDWRPLMLIYAAGFTSIFLLFAWMYRRAWKLRDALQLDAFERQATRTEISAHLISASVGTFAFVSALFGGIGVLVGGLSFWLLGPLHFAHGWREDKKLKAVRGGES